MKVTRKFIEGFVEGCYENGLTEKQASWLLDRYIAEGNGEILEKSAAGKSIINLLLLLLALGGGAYGLDRLGGTNTALGKWLKDNLGAGNWGIKDALEGLFSPAANPAPTTAPAAAPAKPVASGGQGGGTPPAADNSTSTANPNAADNSTPTANPNAATPVATGVQGGGTPTANPNAATNSTTNSTPNATPNAATPVATGVQGGDNKPAVDQSNIPQDKQTATAIENPEIIQTKSTRPGYVDVAPLTNVDEDLHVSALIDQNKRANEALRQQAEFQEWFPLFKQKDGPLEMRHENVELPKDKFTFDSRARLSAPTTKPKAISSSTLVSNMLPTNTKEIENYMHDVRPKEKTVEEHFLDAVSNAPAGSTN